MERHIEFVEDQPGVSRRAAVRHFTPVETRATELPRGLGIVCVALESSARLPIVLIRAFGEG